MDGVNVLDANVVIGFLDGANANHARAVELMRAHEGEPFMMHEITIAEVLAGAAQIDRPAAEQVWSDILQMGIAQADPTATALEVALLRAATGLPIPDCLVVLAAGDPADGNAILTFDERLAAKARSLGHTVLPAV